MRAYALSEVGDRLAIDVFIRIEDAWVAPDDALRDEPQWAGMLFVAPIELERVEAVSQLALSARRTQARGQLAVAARLNGLKAVRATAPGSRCRVRPLGHIAKNLDSPAPVTRLRHALAVAAILVSVPLFLWGLTQDD
jgi:hypothetical protein